MDQIWTTIDEYEQKGVLTEIFVDTEQSTVYIRTRLLGQCWIKSAATSAVRRSYVAWLAATGVKVGCNCKIESSAGSHCIADSAFYMPPRELNDLAPSSSAFPQLVLQVEFSDREDDVTSKVQRFYWQQAFFGMGGTRVDEVWGLFLPSKLVYCQVKETVMKAQAPGTPGPAVPAQLTAATAARPAGFYLVIYTRTHMDVLYDLTLGSCLFLRPTPPSPLFRPSVSRHSLEACSAAGCR